MKILHIITQKPMATGSGTYLTGLMRSLDKEHEQYLISGFNKGDREYLPMFASPFYSDNVEFMGRDLPFPVTGMSDVMPYENTRYKDLSAGDRELLKKVFLKKIEKAVETFRPDLILCQHLYLVTSWAAEFISRHYPEIPVFGFSHGTDLRQLKNIPETREEIIKGLNKLSKILFLHTQQIKTMEELSDGIIEPTKMTVIGSGFDTYIFNTRNRREINHYYPTVSQGFEDLLKYSTPITEAEAIEESLVDESRPVVCQNGERVRVIFTGKVTEAKGVMELIPALQIVSESLPLELIIIGSTSSESDYKKIRNLLSHVSYPYEFRGLLSQEDMVKEYHEGDIFILPSYYEGLPLVVPEALNSGLKAVVTSLPGIKDWLYEYSDLVTFIPMPEMETIDTPAVEARKKFVGDIAAAVLEASGKLGMGSREDLYSLSWDALGERVVKLYYSFLKNEKTEK